MPQIHPTSFIDSAAQLHDSVNIGRWCVIEGLVTIGPNTTISDRVSIKGPATIGSNNRIYQNVSIGYESQDQKFDPDHRGPGTLIGDHNIIREGFTAHRATQDKPTTIGNHNYLMANSHVGHDSIIGNNVTLVNGSLVAGHVEIHDHAIISGNSGIHQFCRMGRYAMTTGCVPVVQDVPPFCVVHYPKRIGGLNVVGMRRAGLRDHIRSLKQAFDILFRQGHLVPNALQLIEEELSHDPICIEFVQFIKSTDRGITSYAAQDRQ